MPRTAFLNIVAILIASGVFLGAAELPPQEADLFESKIRPILVEHCYECHSADKKQKGNLLLDTKEGTLKGGDTGPALVARDAGKSLLITTDDLLPDGVHPNQAGMEKMATTWFAALSSSQ